MVIVIDFNDRLLVVVRNALLHQKSRQFGNRTAHLATINDHVNRAQSTNDVIPTAAKMTAAKLLKKAIAELEKLNDALKMKEREQLQKKMLKKKKMNVFPLLLSTLYQTLTLQSSHTTTI